MSQPITSATSTTPDLAQAAAQVADNQLDTREITSENDRDDKFHENLAEMSVEINRAGSSKDKMARLALLVAQKNLAI